MSRIFCFLLLILTGYYCGSSPLSAEERIDESNLMFFGSIADLREAMVQGNLSSTDLTRFFIARIESLNPELAAVIAINPDALAIAASRDAFIATGKRPGPLHGIPVLVKDNIETRDQPTTGGSLALKDNLTNRDAPVIKQLRDAGAIILGKTNLSEWANFRSEHSFSGWSAVGGQTRNFHNQNNSACGSSSGSAVAVAASLAVAAIGTETDGSITCPAHVSGVVGLKPTVGLVSRRHIIPLAPSQDTAGPITRTIADSALLLEVMSQYDLHDDAMRRNYNYAVRYSNDLNGSLAGTRIGVLRTFTGFHTGVDKTFNDTIKRLQTAGAVIVDQLQVKQWSEFYPDTFKLLLHEFKPALNTYLSALPNQHRNLNLNKLIAFNHQHAEQELALFGQTIFEQAAAITSQERAEYPPLLQRLKSHTRSSIDQLLEQHKLDVLITPTGAPGWTIDYKLGDKFLGGYSTYSAVAGYPHLTLPMGYAYDMPIGLSLIGGAFSEHQLLQIGAAIESLELYQLR